MASGWLLLAVLVQGLIALGIALRLAFERVPRVMRGEVRVRDIALSRDGWPDSAKQAANAFDNQFQLPVLFYVAAAIELYLGVGLVGVLLAWTFVAARVVHAAIHLTTNNVIHRFFAYISGYGLLALWWLVLVARVLAAMAG